MDEKKKKKNVEPYDVSFLNSIINLDAWSGGHPESLKSFFWTLVIENKQMLNFHFKSKN